MSLKFGEIEELFKVFDKDGNGEITLDELKSLFKKLNSDQKIKTGEMRALIRVADKDRSGTISLDEFHHLWDKLMEMKTNLADEEQEIVDEFKALDHNGDGVVSKQEILRTISGYKHLKDREAEAKKCLDEIDIDGDGQVSYSEFLLVWLFSE